MVEAAKRKKQLLIGGAAILLVVVLVLVLIMTRGGDSTDQVEPAPTNEPGTEAAQADKDLMLWYTFNQTEGTLAADASGKGNHGTLTGGASWTTEGKKEGALELDGKNGYVALPVNLTNSLEDFTVSTWIQAPAYDTWGRIFDFGAGTDKWMFLTMKNAGGQAHFAVLKDGTEEAASGSVQLKTGTWQHVALTRTGTSVVLYINGSEVARNDNSSVSPKVLGDTPNNYIGRSQFAPDPYFRGKLDDFRIYSRGLSVSEVMGVIAQSLTEEEAVSLTKDWINLGDTTQVNGNLSLPSAGPGETTITWSSSDEAVLKSDGTVTQPEPGTGDRKVTLTASIKKGAAEASVPFDVTVWEKGATAYQIQIDAGNRAHQVSPTLYGVFYEDINYAADGGLYGELVQNRSFEFGESLYSWTKVGYGGSEGKVTAGTKDPLNKNNLRYARIEVTKAGDGYGLQNAGYTGISVVSGESYSFSVYARSESGLKTPLKVSLRQSNGTVYGECEINGVTGTWQKFTCSIVSNTTDPSAQLVLTVSEPAAVEVDMVSLFPEKTWNNRANGLRYDMAEMVDDLNPSFFRFPGGCIVEGGSLNNYYRWKNTIGDVAEREIQPNQWARNYYQSFGLGFDEYFQYAKDVGAEPLPIVYVGLTSCNGNPPMVPLDQLQPYIDDALNLIEYANGDAKTTKWGAVRAANGHPEPFNLKYLGVGNELWGSNYFARYEKFYDAIKAKYPDMQLVLSAGAFPNDRAFQEAYEWLGRDGNDADLVDEHMYQSPEWFLNNVDRYDNYNRKGPKVFVGEYAAHTSNRRNNMEAALAEAAFMTGLERNSDIVAMAAYAPLFRHINFTQWQTDMIWFNNHKAIGTPSYYVQQMFANHVGDYVLPLKQTQRYEKVNKITGSVLLGTWNTQVEYDDVKVTGMDGTVLFSEDFSGSSLSADWKVNGGTWNVADGVAKQASRNPDTRLVLQKGQEWTDYSLTLRAKKTGGDEGMLIGFAVQDSDDYYWWNLGGWGNTSTAIEKSVGGAKTVIGNNSLTTIKTGEWYDIRIDVDGDKLRAYLNGKLIHEVRDGNTSKEVFSVATEDTETGDLIVKLVNTSTTEQLTKLDIAGAATIQPEATAIVLRGDSPAAENSFDRPVNVATKVETVKGISPSFEYRLPANSVTILRLRTKADPIVVEIPVVELQTKVGQLPVLPETVTVKKSDGKEEQVKVTWRKVDAEQVSTAGLFRVKGKVAGTYHEAAAIVTVQR